LRSEWRRSLQLEHNKSFDFDVDAIDFVDFCASNDNVAATSSAAAANFYFDTLDIQFGLPESLGGKELLLEPAKNQRKVVEEFPLEEFLDFGTDEQSFIDTALGREPFPENNSNSWDFDQTLEEPPSQPTTLDSTDFDPLLFSLQSSAPLNHLQTMGTSLSPTTTQSQSPNAAVNSNSPSTSSSTSSHSLSHHSTPQLNSISSSSSTHSYRVSKSKPGPKPKYQPSTPSTPDDVIDKRSRNNLAAKKYRQKKVDRITELEMMLADMTKERDELKLRLARKEAEGEILREVMRKGS